MKYLLTLLLLMSATRLGAQLGAASTTPEYVEVATGVRLHVIDRGTGPAIVLIPGWPASNTLWETTLLNLPLDKVRAIAVTQRGFGKSDKPNSPINYDVFADDLHNLLIKLNLRNVILVGHSMGGAVVTHYAAKYKSDRLAQLVLVDAAGPRLIAQPGKSGGVPKEVLDNFMAAVRRDRPAFLAEFASNFFEVKPSPQYIANFIADGLQASPIATLEAMQAWIYGDLSAESATIQIPIHIWHGRHDKAVPYAQAAEWQKVMPKARLVTFEKSGHAPYVEEMEKFNAELLQLARVK